MQENEIVEAEFEEIDESVHAVEAEFEKAVQDVKTSAQPTPTPSKTEILRALKAAIDGGSLSANQAKRIRQDMGIFKSGFTGKKTTDAQRKAKRKQQKIARKKARK